MSKSQTINNSKITNSNPKSTRFGHCNLEFVCDPSAGSGCEDGELAEPFVKLEFPI